LLVMFKVADHVILILHLVKLLSQNLLKWYNIGILYIALQHKYLYNRIVVKTI
jgi:hypothetical protein